jgi:hypothetical protein
MATQDFPTFKLVFRYSSAEQVVYIKTATIVELQENEILTLTNSPQLGSAAQLHYEIENAEPVTGVYYCQLPLLNLPEPLTGTDAEKRAELRGKIQTKLENDGLKFWVITVVVFRPETGEEEHATATIASNATIELD